jgi:hypothetical protein
MKLTNKILVITLIVILVSITAIIVYSRILIEKGGDFSEFEEFNTDIYTDQFDISDFNGIKVDGVIKVNIEKSNEYSVTIKSPGYVDVIVGRRDNILEIKTEYMFGNEFLTEAVVTMPELIKIVISDSVNLTFTNFDANRFEIICEGAGFIKGISNTIQHLELKSNGTMNIDLQKSSINSATIETLGAVSAVLTMSGGKLTGRASGTGSVTYYGEVEEENIITQGNVLVLKK